MSMHSEFRLAFFRLARAERLQRAAIAQVREPFVRNLLIVQRDRLRGARRERPEVLLLKRDGSVRVHKHVLRNPVNRAQVRMALHGALARGRPSSSR